MFQSTVTYDLAPERRKFTDQVYMELKEPLLCSGFTKVEGWLGGKGKKMPLGIKSSSF